MLLIRAMVQLFSFGERWNVLFSDLPRWIEHFHVSPHENICTIALITIHYLYINNGKKKDKEHQVKMFSASGPWYLTQLGSLVSQLCFTSRRQRGHLETAPPIYCPLRRTWSSVFTPSPPGIEPRVVAWKSITQPLRHASSLSQAALSDSHPKPACQAGRNCLPVLW